MQQTLPAPKAKNTNSKEGKLAFLRARLWPVKTTGATIESLDGLRGIAALLVVMVHIGNNLTLRSSSYTSGHPFMDATWFLWYSGVNGVQLFFILSGFLLFIPYAQTLLGLKPFPSTGRFLGRRAFRILPAYWLSLAVLVLFSGGKAGVVDFKLDVALHIFMLHNWSLDTIGSFQGPFWTMPTEVQFYLLLPLIGFVLYRLTTRSRNLRLWIGLLVAAGFLSSPITGLLEASAKDSWPAFVNHLTIIYAFAYMTLFATGMLCSYFYVRSTVPSSTGKFSLFAPEYTVAIRVAGIVAFVLMLGQALLNSNTLSAIDARIQNWFIVNPLLAISFGALLIETLRKGSLCWRLLSHPAIRFIGVISFSLYLWHLPVLVNVITPLVDKWSLHSEFFGLFLYLVLTLVIIIPVSYISYMLVERPFINLSKQLFK